MSINEDTVYRKLVTKDGMIYTGPITVMETGVHAPGGMIGSLVVATDGKYVFPMTSVKVLIIDEGVADDAGGGWQPGIYEPDEDDGSY